MTRPPRIVPPKAAPSAMAQSALAQMIAAPPPGITVTERREPAREAHQRSEPTGANPAPPPGAPQSSEPAAETRQEAVLARSGEKGQFHHLPAAAAERLTAFASAETSAEAPASAARATPARSASTDPKATRREQPKLPLRPGDSELQAAIAASRRAFTATGTFSLVINLLMLAGPLFMLQVYDRVLTSGSIPTLVALAIMTAGLYAIIGVLELVRTRVIVRIGVEIDRRLGERIFHAALRHSLAAPGQSMSALRELDSLRQFIAGPGPLTFFDAPWTPIYLLVIFMTHWTLGVAATLGAIVLMVIAWLSETSSRAPLAEAAKAATRSVELAETGQRNAEAIAAMGMMSAYRARWQKANEEAISWQVYAADRLGTLSSLSKALRLLLQSLILAIGAALAIKGDISAGAIVAATIIFGRALAPVEQAIGHWRSFVKAHESYRKLDALLRQEPPVPPKTALPAPKGHLEVSNLRVASPETRQLILSNISFAVAPGSMLAIIGPSASGKSTLARTLVGLWQPFSGSVRLDGARLDQWNQEELGRHIGYLPQDVELFAGTVRENIARFRADATDEQVTAAARMAHAHELIMALPKGYETEIGTFGTYLSAGQRQRIGLARALFGDPALVVLDEPNSNLDRTGDEALASAIDGMRRRGQAVVLISHRVQAIGKADFLLYLERGVQRAYGPRDDVMKLFQAQPPRAAAGGER